MIGLVVVSHSRALARAAVELATEILPDQQVRIEIAAGLDENTFGTDAVAVADAITAADTGDGVLVLMDLGSAVLSAETALEFVPSPGQVRLSGAPLVEGLVTAVAAAGGGATLDSVAWEADHALAGKHLQLDQSPSPAHRYPDPPPPGAPPPPALHREALILVTNPHGLHARPAAALVAALRALDAEVDLRNATTGTGPVPADSLTRVLTLGLLPGHHLAVTASGPEAARAIQLIRDLATGEATT
ncbi:dihydroxyacetone kinase phosphoryl donor subunit DhaM [Nocardia crassostreae]|uniref:dihydroxyacetone kinase phosphoryl donor subunit DhaM n=1 Tax=Nocardia crassostreae TaxID=53428 RepID=UPI00083535FF|nr:dihydroxyacetone kinase phosphoryl donor subunit DhaM [Nocardia crassostreae]